MKRYFLIPLVGALILATACKKDDEIEHTIPPEPFDPTEVDTNYVVGRYERPVHLATLTEENETHYFSWDNSETPRLLSVGPTDQVRTIEYDDQGRQLQVNIPATALGGAQVMRFTYGYDLLQSMQLKTADGATLITAAPTFDGNRMASIYYEDVDQEVISRYISNFFNNDSKELVGNISVTNLQATYSWTGSNVSGEHLMASGTADLAVGGLVQMLNLDTSFYRMIIETSGLDEQIPGITPELLANFVDLMSDSSCHIVVDVDLYNRYTYDSHPNPLYGFWGWGFLGNTRVLSQHNISGTVREGLATANLSVNLPTSVPSTYDLFTRIALTAALAYLNNEYPGGFHYSYPIDLDGEEHYRYTYNNQGWPLTATDDNGQITTYTYED